MATSQSYNAFAEVQAFTAGLSGATLLAQTYAYDKLGRIVQKAEQVQGQADGYSYGYDAAGRLETVSKNGAVITTYQYDTNGNRISDGVNQASYDAQDRLVQYGAATYAYTDNGELKTQTVGSQQTQYDYDVAGNLRKVTLPDGTGIDYVIDGRNRRIGKRVNGVLTQGLLYQDQLNPVAELNGVGAVQSRFIYASKPNVPDYMQKDGKTYRVLSDHLGSVRIVVDTASGEVAQRIDYDAYGFVIQDTNPGFQPFGFAGGMLDQHTKLTRFGARDYDALTGRWTAKDPISFDGGDINLFAYVANDPLNFIDPLGLAGESPVIPIPWGPTLVEPNSRGDPQGGGGGSRPANFTPPGAGRLGAFNEAKRMSGIPTSQQPSATRPNTDLRGNPQPGRQYDFEVPAPGGGTRLITLRDDARGHIFGPGNAQNRGPHFNDMCGRHFDY